MPAILFLTLLFADGPAFEAQRGLLRRMPPSVRVPGLLELARNNAPTKAVAVSLAREAWQTALAIDRSIDLKDFPLALRRGESPDFLAALAWRELRTLGVMVDFPVRPLSTPAQCHHTAIDDIRPYLTIAREAGMATFAAAVQSARSPREIEAALELLLQSPSPESLELALATAGRLRRATLSRREFESVESLSLLLRRLAAHLDREQSAELESHHRFFMESNQSLPPCEATGAPTPVRFEDRLTELIHIPLDQSSGYAWREKMLDLLSSAGLDEARLEQLDAAGNDLISALVAAHRRSSKP